VTSQPRAFFTLDLGSATTSAALLGHVGGRWRLIAHMAAPASLDVEVMLVGLLRQTQATDPALLADLADGEAPEIAALAATWPRLVSRTTPQRRIAVLAGSRRQRRRLEEAALRAGWLVVGGSGDENDPVELSRLILSTRTQAVLLGADRTPAGDERRHLPDVAALVAAIRRLRPELTVILAGGAAAYEMAFLAEPANGREGQPPGQKAEAAVAPGADEKAGQSKGEAEASSGAETPSQGGALPEAGAPPEAAAAPGPDGQPIPEGPSGQSDDQSPAHAGAALEASDARQAGAGSDSPALAEQTPPLAALPAFLTMGARSNGVRDYAPTAHVLLAPDAEAGQPAGSSLQQVLEGLRAFADDGRLGIGRSVASLAYVLDRSIEVVEVGLQGGLRARSEPFGEGHFAVVSTHACLAEGSFSPSEPPDDVIDGVSAWTTAPLDRHRLIDRLLDLRFCPWGDAQGDGAAFRLGAAKAALSRLVDATAELATAPMPDLIVAAGGIFASAPPSVVALAIADLIRRPGVSMLVCDQARLLGPLGAVEDEAERRLLLANLADDILVPLGTLILPAGVKPGRSGGSLKLKGTGSGTEIELHPGAIQVVDLPPGRAAKAEFDFRDTVRLDSRGHHFDVDVSGGLCGLLVDLRDIPLRMSDRPESRRDTLTAWQRGMWPEVDE
jgi:hypothetical protein